MSIIKTNNIRKWKQKQQNNPVIQNSKFLNIKSQRTL